MLIIWLIRLAFVATTIGGLCFVIWRSTGETKAPTLKVGISTLILGIIGMFWAFTSITYVSPTEMKVVENTSTGSLKVIGPGLHMWPFDPKLVPFVSNVSTYDFTAQSFDIGAGDKTNKDGIQADSNSPGRPVVYFHDQIKVTPNKDKLLDLHRKFGPNYLNIWVRQAAESATKTVQGGLEYDYVGNKRGDFELKVREELERRLKLDVGETWIYVNQVIVVNYDYDDSTNAALKNVVDTKFKVAQATEEVNLALQKKQVTETNAKADASVITTKADAEAAAKKAAANAESFRLTTEADGQAAAITKIQSALASSPTYIQLQQVQRWNGALPQFFGGSEPIPFFSLPTGSTPTPAGSTK